MPPPLFHCIVDTSGIRIRDQCGRELEMEEQSAQLFRSDANAVEMEKAKHVKAQRTIWDNLLGMCVGGCF